MPDHGQNKEEPLESGDVAPVALPERPSAPARPANEVAGTEPPRGRPDTDRRKG